MALGKNQKIAIGIGLVVVLVIVMAIVYFIMRSQSGAFSNKMMQMDLTGHCLTTEMDDNGILRPQITICKPELADRWSFKPSALVKDPNSGKRGGVIKNEKNGLCMQAGTYQEGGVCHSYSETSKDYIYDISMQKCDVSNPKQQFVHYKANEFIHKPKPWVNYDETPTNLNRWKNLGVGSKTLPQCLSLGDYVQLEECYERRLKDCVRVQKWHPYGD